MTESSNRRRKDSAKLTTSHSAKLQFPNNSLRYSATPEISVAEAATGEPLLIPRLKRMGFKGSPALPFL